MAGGGLGFTDTGDAEASFADGDVMIEPGGFGTSVVRVITMSIDGDGTPTIDGTMVVEATMCRLDRWMGLLE